MPVYDFECTTCGLHFERTQRITDHKTPDCPAGHHTVRRVYTAPAVIYRGSGFYVTDHRRSDHGSGSGS